jgi:hypothetical protein
MLRGREINLAPELAAHIALPHLELDAIFHSQI